MCRLTCLVFHLYESIGCGSSSLSGGREFFQEKNSNDEWEVVITIGGRIECCGV